MVNSLGVNRLNNSQSRPPFTPKYLFNQGEQGVWYDPSDLSTLYQDSAGTTPVTAVEQPVGLMLDKSRGGRQSLPVTGWVKNNGDGAVTVDGNTITITGATTTTRVDIPAPGWVVGDHADVTVAGSVAGATGQALYLGGGGMYTALSGTSTFRNVIAASTLLRLQIVTGSATFVVSSRGYVPGNHAFQTTSASRPTLSARVNLLTKSEQFDDAVWTKTNASVTANATTAPDGTTTADKIEATASTYTNIYQTFTGTGTTMTCSVYAKKGSGATIANKFTVRNATTATNIIGGNVNYDTLEITYVYGSSGISVEAVGDWLRITLSLATTSGNSYRFSITDDGEFLSTAGNYAYVWGADVRVANDGVDIPSYQRVNTSTDYDTTGFPLYLKFDGADDYMVTNTITPSTAANTGRAALVTAGWTITDGGVA